jgi:CheY-like chemotaxis protein/predicted regulator of Ras-like GTPase activity (Roadblock/LC7/MglB family)
MKYVLIVDDEERLLLTMQAGFAPFKDRFEIITARNGREASEILAATRIDLVVTDLKMPEMDGFDLLAFLKNNFPEIPAIVMTAFATPDIETRLEKTGMIQMLEKPVDFEELTQLITRQLEENPTGGVLTGISLQSFLQLIEMEQNTCLMEVSSPESKKQGLLYFNKGVLFDAVYDQLRAEEAVYAMVAVDDVKISFRPLPSKKMKRHIKANLMTLIMEGVRRKDEQENGMILLDDPIEEAEIQADQPAATGNQDTSTKGDNKMAEMKEILEKLKTVDGFQAVGVFSPNGEMVAESNVAGINLAEIGALANDVLLKAQKSTEIMQIGRGQMVHVEAPKGHVICRCLNESTDFSSTSTGRAHLHMVLLLSAEGNLAMGKMKIGSVIQEMAEFFR